MRRMSNWFWMAALVAGVGTTVGKAVMFLSTDSPAYNTSAPTGGLTNSGWQYQGQWSSYLGTPIAPQFFIAAQHVNSGDTNWAFVFNGYTYHPVSFTNSPDADLTIWRVAETFPWYAPLFTGTNEAGQHCVVFGRGTQRGNPVIVDGVTNGWYWGAGDGVQRWGENDVELIITDATYGSLLRCTFDRNGGSNECHLSVGDSSGAMFINEGGVWKLAGIHVAVDGYFSTNGSSQTETNAALLDMGGLWEGANNNWQYITNQVADIPSGFYSTRISAHTNWINSVIHFLPGPDLQLSIALAPPDVILHLGTGTNRLYRVEYASNLAPTDWTPLTNNLAGTGGTVTVVDTGAATNMPRRFYRLLLLP